MITYWPVPGGSKIEADKLCTQVFLKTNLILQVSTNKLLKKNSANNNRTTLSDQNLFQLCSRWNNLECEVANESPAVFSQADLTREQADLVVPGKKMPPQASMSASSVSSGFHSTSSDYLQRAFSMRSRPTTSRPAMEISSFWPEGSNDQTTPPPSYDTAVQKETRFNVFNEA